jgi:hypothetical protein
MLEAEHGSFRSGAIATDLSQTTLSRRLQLLERRLAFLFLRGRETEPVSLPLVSASCATQLMGPSIFETP